MDDLRLLLVPGGGGSGPQHWHRFWAASDDRCHWVEQADWEGGTRADWVGALEAEVARHDGPTILVAHSLGCVVTAHWAGDETGPVVGAMLVAPADIETSDELAGAPYNQFVPIPRTPLPFPSVVVASSNDPLLSVERAEDLASAWGAEVAEIGPHLHVGSDAELGQWPEGRAILDELISQIS